MAKRTADLKDYSLYRGERASFTTDDVVELHAAMTEKSVIRQEEVKLNPAYGLQGYRKGLYDFPNRVVAWGLTEIDAGVRSPLHRQLHEATLFILQGKGYSLINGKRFDWQEGDAVFAPLFSWHQNGNDGSETVRYVTAGTIPFFRHLGIYREEDSKDPASDEIKRLASEMPQNPVVKKKDWYQKAAEGGNPIFDFPYKIGSNRIPSCVPANTDSRFVHRHFNEALIYIMNGKGFSLVHDKKVEWSAGCAMRVPTFCWHHHYNLGNEPVVYLKNITSSLNNHLKWILMDNLPGREIGDTPLKGLAAQL